MAQFADCLDSDSDLPSLAELATSLTRSFPLGSAIGRTQPSASQDEASQPTVMTGILNSFHHSEIQANDKKGLSDLHHPTQRVNSQSGHGSVPAIPTLCGGEGNVNIYRTGKIQTQRMRLLIKSWRPRQVILPYNSLTLNQTLKMMGSMVLKSTPE